MSRPLRRKESSASLREESESTATSGQSAGYDPVNLDDEYHQNYPLPFAQSLSLPGSQVGVDCATEPLSPPQPPAPVHIAHQPSSTTAEAGQTTGSGQKQKSVKQSGSGGSLGASFSANNLRTRMESWGTFFSRSSDQESPLRGQVIGSPTNFQHVSGSGYGPLGNPSDPGRHAMLVDLPGSLSETSTGTQEEAVTTSPGPAITIDAPPPAQATEPETALPAGNSLKLSLLFFVLLVLTEITGNSCAVAITTICVTGSVTPYMMGWLGSGFFGFLASLFAFVYVASRRMSKRPYYKHHHLQQVASFTLAVISQLSLTFLVVELTVIVYGKLDHINVWLGITVSILFASLVALAFIYTRRLATRNHPQNEEWLELGSMMGNRTDGDSNSAAQQSLPGNRRISSDIVSRITPPRSGAVSRMGQRSPGRGRGFQPSSSSSPPTPGSSKGLATSRSNDTIDQLCDSYRSSPHAGQQTYSRPASRQTIGFPRIVRGAAATLAEPSSRSMTPIPEREE